VPGLITINTCSECSDAVPCADGLLCSSTIDVSEFAGHNFCVEPGAQPNGATCRSANEGADCASGFCGVVDVEGILSLDVCGECNEDTDCADGMICQAGTINTSDFSVSGATCVMP